MAAGAGVGNRGAPRQSCHSLPVTPPPTSALPDHEHRGRPSGVPVLPIRGEVSTLPTAATAARMRALHPGMAFASVPGVGHAPILTEPPAREALVAFLARLDGKELSA